MKMNESKKVKVIMLGRSIIVVVWYHSSVRFCREETTANKADVYSVIQKGYP